MEADHIPVPSHPPSLPQHPTHSLLIPARHAHLPGPNFCRPPAPADLSFLPHAGLTAPTPSTAPSIASQ